MFDISPLTLLTAVMTTMARQLHMHAHVCVVDVIYNCYALELYLIYSCSYQQIGFSLIINPEIAAREAMLYVIYSLPNTYINVT